MYRPKPRASMWTPQHPAGKTLSPSPNPNLGVPRPLCPNPALFPTHRAPTSILSRCPRNLRLLTSHPSWSRSAAPSPHLSAPLPQSLLRWRLSSPTMHLLRAHAFPRA